MDEEEKRLKKQAIKEAMREWLDEEMKKTFETIGKWVTHTFAVLILGACVYLILVADGWKKM